MRWVVGLAVVAVGMLVGCGSDGDGDESALVPLELSASSPAGVRRCLDEGGASELESRRLVPSDIPGRFQAKGVFGTGPGGGRIGVVLAEDAYIAEIAGKSIAAQSNYSVSRSANGRTIVVFDDQATKDDESLAAECVGS